MGKLKSDFVKIEKKIHRKFKAIVFVIFIILAFSLIYFAFFDTSKIGFTGIPLIGNIVGGNQAEKINLNESIYISTNLNIPELEVKGTFQEIELTLPRNAVLNAGAERFQFPYNKNSIILTNYRGEINIVGDKLSLDGIAEQILINSVPVRSRASNRIDILVGKSSYNNLKIDEVYIDKLEYLATGSIGFNDGRAEINPENERIMIKNFLGSLSAGNNLVLKGHTEKLEVFGETRISISK